MRTDGTSSEGSDYISALMNLGGLDVLRICPNPHVILNKRRIIFLNTAAVILLDGSEAEEFLHKDII